MLVLLGYLFNLIFVVIFAKVALSFIMPIAGRNPHPMLVKVNLLINQITEPIFAPIRRYTVFSGIDFSPFVVILVVIVIRRALGA